MPKLSFEFTKISVAYVIIILLGTTISWVGLTWMGIANPIWAVISVVLVSDPDSTATKQLVRTRVINTLVGCFLGLLSLLLLGYQPAVIIITVALTTLLVTTIKHYPANWRLAPATVIILSDAAHQAVGHSEQFYFALLRAGEIAFGCSIAVILSYACKHLRLHKTG